MNRIKSKYKCVSRTVFMAGLFLATVCAHASAADKSDSHTAANKNENHAAPHWQYSGNNGPLHWGELANEYALCKSGKRQSPVDIHEVQNHELYPLTFHYKPVTLQAVNNGHTLQANYNTASENDSVTIGEKTYPLKSKAVYRSELLLGDVSYKLLQFHFHTPSEHAHEGERYAMEVHLVHKNSDGNLAVVGMFLKRGVHNPTLQKVLDNASTTINEVNVVPATTVNAADLLPENRSFYHYSGSLTKPPCSENVNWFVMKSPVEVSDQQVSRFARLIGENARPLQEMNWRSLLGSL